MEIDVKGAEDIALVSRAVRSLGADRKIVTEMAQEIRKAVPPIRAAVRRNAVDYLPHRGGLGAWVARALVRANIRRSATNAGIKIVDGRNSTAKRSDFKAINRGKVRHPSWGNRKAWSLQTVRPGFFDDAITQDGAEAFRAAVVVAVDRAAGKVLRG